MELKEILEKLENHFSPKPSVIVERFKFHSRSGLKGENVAEFVAGLRRLSEHCKFGTTLEDVLRDRLVCGISDDRIQRRLLGEQELTFEKAVEIATATKMDFRNVMDLGGKMPSNNNNVNKVEEEIAPPKFQPKRECYRCGGDMGTGRMVNKEHILLKKAPIKMMSMPCIICPAIERNRSKWIWNFVDGKT